MGDLNKLKNEDSLSVKDKINKFIEDDSSDVLLKFLSIVGILIVLSLAVINAKQLMSYRSQRIELIEQVENRDLVLTKDKLEDKEALMNKIKSDNFKEFYSNFAISEAAFNQYEKGYDNLLKYELDIQAEILNTIDVIVIKDERLLNKTRALYERHDADVQKMKDIDIEKVYYLRDLQSESEAMFLLISVFLSVGIVSALIIFSEKKEFNNGKNS